MSSPSANLKKVKRPPLPGYRGMPYRPEISPLKETSSFHKQVLEAIKHESSVPQDTDLVASMATRLTVVEKELLAAKREIIDKVYLL